VAAGAIATEVKANVPLDQILCAVIFALEHRALSAEALALAFERLAHQDEVFWIADESLSMGLPSRDVIERVGAMAKGFMRQVKAAATIVANTEQ
jgi:hypothetical protein